MQVSELADANIQISNGVAVVEMQATDGDWAGMGREGRAHYG